MYQVSSVLQETVLIGFGTSQARGFKMLKTVFSDSLVLLFPFHLKDATQIELFPEKEKLCCLMPHIFYKFCTDSSRNKMQRSFIFAEV